MKVMILMRVAWSNGMSNGEQAGGAGGRASLVRVAVRAYLCACVRVRGCVRAYACVRACVRARAARAGGCDPRLCACGHRPGT